MLKERLHRKRDGRYQAAAARAAELNRVRFYVDTKHVISSDVATGWTEVDMSTPLLPEVAPEIDTNPTSFYRGGGSVRLRFGLDWPVGSVRSALAMSVHPTCFDLATPPVISETFFPSVNLLARY